MELYYLQSRYYDPEMGRFINADAFASTGQGLLGNNMFAYCGNNPIIRQDTCGQYYESALDIAAIGLDIAELAANPQSLLNWGALAADVVGLVLPGVTGGGTIVRVVASSDTILDVAKYSDDIIDASKAMTSTRELGQQLHKMYDPIQDTISEASKWLNRSLKNWNSNLRPDAIDFMNGIIFELKPYNSRGLKQAIKQTLEYAQTLGGKWTIIIDMYTK